MTGMDPEPTAIPGCFIVPLFHHGDARGEFVKVFQSSTSSPSVDLTIAELFWSRSTRGVVRGLHFQIPPHAHAKLVTIISGTALDVVVDLRVGSPAFGEPHAFTLDASSPVAIVVPVGCAHGFQATSGDATILYATSTEHVPEADRGIRWDTIGAPWPIADPIISARDAGFPALVDFDSPFRFEDPS